MKKKLMALLLCTCLAAGLLTGCSGKDGGSKEGAGTGENGNSSESGENSGSGDGEGGGSGKYVEEDAGVPLKDNETAVSLLRWDDGRLEVYAQGKENGGFSKYVSEDGTEWKEEDASWLTKIAGAKVQSLAAGKDGSTYAIMVDEADAMHLLKSTAGGAAEEIEIPDLMGEKGIFYSFGTNLAVMENGNILLAGNSELRIYQQADAKQLGSYPLDKLSTDSRTPMDIKGVNLVLPNKENNGFTVYNTESNAEESKLSYGSEVREGRVILEEGNDVYYVNKEGIHHMQPDGSVAETLMEGTSRTMGAPGSYILDFVKGKADDFYVLYNTQNESNAVKHYYFDKNAKIESDQTLTIYSLRENRTVRQAISVFNQSHPEAEISYKTGSEDTATTKADKIRVLNTELLNKNGADILILDDLPVDSLTEKGVLSDLSDLFDPMIEDGTIQKNLAEPYRNEDGSIYCMPAKFGIPVLYGTKEWLDALESLDALEAFLNAHPGEAFMDSSSYYMYNNFLISTFYDELFDQDGKLKADKLTQCLNCIQEIGRRAEADMERGREEIEDVINSLWVAGNGLKLLKEDQAVSEEMLGVSDMMIAYRIMREKGISPKLNKDVFVPHTLAGVNSAAKEQELAKEFIKTLFSVETQEYDLNDGFPMNENARSKVVDQGLNTLEEGENTLSVGAMGDDGEAFGASLPLKTEIEQLFTLGKELKKPAAADSILLEMIFDEAKAYYEGNQTVEQTVQGITAKVDTYFAE